MTLGRNDRCSCGSGLKYKRCCGSGTKPSLASVPMVKSSSISLEMEQLMGKIGKLVESKNVSIEDLDRFFVGRTIDDINEEFADFGHQSERDRAQDIIFSAYEEGNSRKRRKMIDEALSIYPHLSDAWIMLGDESATSEDAIACYERAVKEGEADLGERFFSENEGHFWGMTESRPYMRAKAHLAGVLWELGREDEAIFHLKDCLRLNPNDNQGLRDPLMCYLLLKNDLDGAEKILGQYKDDSGAQHSFNEALFLFKKYGADSKKAREKLNEALKGNSSVMKYLLGKVRIPKALPDSYSIGSNEEAVIYASGAKRAWDETPGALSWLLLVGKSVGSSA